MKPTNHLQQMFYVKDIHMKEIKRQQKQIQRLEWVISACIGASITLAFVIAHQMIVTEWTW